jgi:hypothetical protein
MHQGAGVPRAQPPGSQEAQEHSPVILSLAQEHPKIMQIRLAEEPAQGTAWIPEGHLEIADEEPVWPGQLSKGFGLIFHGAAQKPWPHVHPTRDPVSFPVGP